MSRPAMKRRVRVLTPVFLAAALAAAMAPAGTEDDRLKQVGAEALKPFKQQLMSALMQGLKESPEAAIQVCSEKAPQIALAAAGEGITLGRTSSRLRNPGNAPDAWLEPLLMKYAGTPGLKEPSLVALPDGGHGYVEPIFILPACLKCHGERLAPGVSEKLEALYPEDAARGFAKGDFRGLFWVRIE